MKKILYAILFFAIACKPEKSPEPEKIEVISKLKINVKQNTFEVNQSIQPSALIITGLDTTKVTESILWTSSNTELAIIDESNTLTFLKEGIIKLYANSDGLSDSIQINIISESQIAREIELSKNDLELDINQKDTIKVLVFDQNNNSIELENTSWTSANTNIVSIENGIITPISFGETEIYSKSNGLVSTTIKVRIYRKGTFKGTEGHSASGDVRLIERNGQLFVETQNNFLVQSGAPDLRLFLSNIENGKINNSAMEISLAPNTSGKLSFPIPISVSITDYQYILFHCKQYNTTFGSASLN